jgi:hypothetical protein
MRRNMLKDNRIKRIIGLAEESEDEFMPVNHH